MLDIFKKFFDSREDAELLKSIESIEKMAKSGTIDPEVSVEKKGFFEKLFEHVEEAHAQNKTNIPFKISFLREDELIVKVKGLFAHLPLSLMAWQYPKRSYWNLIFPTLAGREFKCRITEATHIEGERPFHIVIDAAEHPFRKAELIENAEYTGIVLEKTEDEALVDMGSHFRWKYGSLPGYLPLADLAKPETFQSCEPGEQVKIRYLGCDERGHRFTSTGGINPKEWIGQIVWVQVCKSENLAPYFLVKGKYKGDLPVTKILYPVKKKKIRTLKNQWQNGDIINCRILEFHPKQGFILQWIDPEPDPIDWTSDDMIDYIGREVEVNVHVTKEEELYFLIEDKYPATFTARNRSNKKYELDEGDIIAARVCSIDLSESCFKIRWLNKDPDSPPDE
ncbi:MAG: hypothetical protein LBH19_08340 [Dysgonamonadaceae bacterium]|jgi:hypothetical protein|nr:hypothetical protein [Dysgonamonadaceae bacterium]